MRSRAQKPLTFVCDNGFEILFYKRQIRLNMTIFSYRVCLLDYCVDEVKNQRNHNGKSDLKTWSGRKSVITATKYYANYFHHCWKVGFSFLNFSIFERILYFHSYLIYLMHFSLKVEFVSFDIWIRNELHFI